MVPPLLLLALEFHQAPLRFRHLTDPRRPLPEAFGVWLAESSAALAPAHVEATAEALGTAPDAIRDAYLFLLRQVLLLPQADHYRVLGLARGCSSESIKRHHGLLVRLFHPDRLQEDGERCAALTARINNAHHVLRDPEARRLYDQRLPPLPAGERSNDDPAAFFRPQGPLVPVGLRPGIPTALASRTGSLLWWALGCVVLMTLVYAVVREPGQPLLRVNPDLAGATPQGPAYMQGGAASGQGPETPGQGSTEPTIRRSHGSAAPTSAPTPAPAPAAAKATVGADARGPAEAAKPVSAADGSAPADSRPGRQAPAAAASRDAAGPEASPKAGNAKMPESVAREAAAAPQGPRPQGASGIPGPQQAKPALDVRERPPSRLAERAEQEPGVGEASVRGASELVSHLERSFTSGDVAGMVKLFTANAVVNGGIGVTGVLNAYWGIIRQGGERRMTLSGLSWRRGQHERLLGRGMIRISTRPGPQGDWSHTAGAVDIELVPAIGDYKIAKLSHRLSGR